MSSGVSETTSSNSLDIADANALLLGASEAVGVGRSDSANVKEGELAASEGVVMKVGVSSNGSSVTASAEGDVAGETLGSDVTVDGEALIVEDAAALGEADESETGPSVLKSSSESTSTIGESFGSLPSSDNEFAADDSDAVALSSLDDRIREGEGDREGRDVSTSSPPPLSSGIGSGRADTET